jgi:PKD repeat protein
MVSMTIHTIASNRSKIHALTVIIMLIAIPVVTTIVAANEFNTEVSISPSNQTASPEETFSVEIYCIPDQSIKSFGFGLSFDASLLEAISVTEGDIFNDHTTFFNPGTIDNAEGNINDVFNLILGSGNISNPGTFVTILFTAKINTGTSFLNLNNVEVTNETGYVIISVDNGTVTVKGTNNDPYDPGTPSGPTAGNVDQSSSYSTSTTDPDGDQVQYRFDWDADGTHEYSEWTNLVDSGTSASKSHAWSTSGTYFVKTQARDEHGAISEWSSGFAIVISEIPSKDLTINNPSPANGSTNVPISTASLNINIQDPDGDTFNYRISTSPNIGSSSGNESSNGSKSCSISDLGYSTTYTWYVSCMDTGSGNWTNKSYWFTTESSGGDGDGDGDGDGGGLPPPGDDTNDTSGQNNPPETPVKPSGPTFVEKGVEYIFMSSTYDITSGEQIRYRFDWGDGNYSNWSDFMSSNASVSMSYHWILISNYSIRVMAQDENDSNSSWSPALSVTVSQAESGEIPPVADVNVSGNVSASQIIVFNASGSYDIDGIIISYQWDFGDGTTGSGVSPEHVYENPGEYTVTLVITDNNGNTYSKTMAVNIASETKEEQSEEQQEMLLHFGIIFVGLIVFIIGVLAVFFIDNVKSFFSGYDIHQFLHRAVSRNKYEVGGIESNIEKTKISANVCQGTVIPQSKLASETDFKRSSVVSMSNYYDETRKNHIENDYGNKLGSEESTFSDNSYEFHTGEKIEEILREELKSDKSPIEDSEVSKARDIESIVDNLILSNTKKKLSAENDNIFDESTDNL